MSRETLVAQRGWKPIFVLVSNGQENKIQKCSSTLRDVDSTFIPTCPESRRRQEDAVSPAVHSKQVMQVFVLTTEKSMNINEPFSNMFPFYYQNAPKRNALGSC